MSFADSFCYQFGERRMFLPLCGCGRLFSHCGNWHPPSRCGWGVLQATIPPRALAKFFRVSSLPMFLFFYRVPIIVHHFSGPCRLSFLANEVSVPCFRFPRSLTACRPIPVVSLLLGFLFLRLFSAFLFLFSSVVFQFRLSFLPFSVHFPFCIRRSFSVLSIFSFTLLYVRGFLTPISLRSQIVPFSPLGNLHVPSLCYLVS